jgi:uncharacterized coiled-coil DUF342 family protein
LLDFREKIDSLQTKIVEKDGELKKIHRERQAVIEELKETKVKLSTVQAEKNASASSI